MLLLHYIFDWHISVPVPFHVELLIAGCPGWNRKFCKTYFSFISNWYLSVSWSLLKGEIHLKSSSIIFHHLSQCPRLCEEGDCSRFVRLDMWWAELSGFRIITWVCFGPGLEGTKTYMISFTGNIHILCRHLLPASLFAWKDPLRQNPIPPIHTNATAEIHMKYNYKYKHTNQQKAWRDPLRWKSHP